MNFVCVVFELGDKTLTLSPMENLMVKCNHQVGVTTIQPFLSNCNCKGVAEENVTPPPHIIHGKFNPYIRV